MRDDKPGVDWPAKYASGGSNAQPTTDRPCDAWPYTHTISESDVTTNPNVNVIDRD